MSRDERADIVWRRRRPFNRLTDNFSFASGFSWLE